MATIKCDLRAENVGGRISSASHRFEVGVPDGCGVNIVPQLLKVAEAAIKTAVAAGSCPSDARSSKD